MDYLAVCKAPDESVERAELGLNIHESLGVADRCRNLQFVSNDAFVLAQSLQFHVIVFRHFQIVKVIKCLLEGFSFVENTFPRKTGLKTFENQHLEQLAVIMHRHSPFRVVIGNIQGDYSDCTSGNVVWYWLHFRSYSSFIVLLPLPQRSTKVPSVQLHAILVEYAKDTASAAETTDRPDVVDGVTAVVH